MTNPELKRKRRGIHATTPTPPPAKPAANAEAKPADKAGTSAPSHMGAQVTDAGYRSGTGVFGFRQMHIDESSWSS